MRISDWSSDVCSSDLRHDHGQEYRDHAFSRVRGGKLHHPLRDLTAEFARMGDSEQFIAKRAAFRAYHLRLNGYPSQPEAPCPTFLPLIGMNMSGSRAISCFLVSLDS